MPLLRNEVGEEQVTFPKGQTVDSLLCIIHVRRNAFTVMLYLEQLGYKPAYEFADSVRFLVYHNNAFSKDVTTNICHRLFVT